VATHKGAVKACEGAIWEIIHGDENRDDPARNITKWYEERFEEATREPLHPAADALGETLAKTATVQVVNETKTIPSSVAPEIIEVVVRHKKRMALGMPIASACPDKEALRGFTTARSPLWFRRSCAVFATCIARWMEQERRGKFQGAKA
jgi:hypothetical protein